MTEQLHLLLRLQKHYPSLLCEHCIYLSILPYYQPYNPSNYRFLTYIP